MNDTITRWHGRYLGILERRDWEYTTRVNAQSVVVIVAVTDNDELVLVEQYRIPVESRVIELPAGLVGDHGAGGESALDAARRELEEETGFSAGRWSLLKVCPSSAGLTDEMLNIYLAGDLRPTGPGGGDDSEDITVHLVPMTTVADWIDARVGPNVMVDPKVYAALFWLSQRPGGKDGETTDM